MSSPEDNPWRRVSRRIGYENPWVKVWDSLFGEIPIVGMFSGYVFHPAYLVVSPDDRVLMKMEKQPAFFQGKFSIEKMAQLSVEDERRAFLSLMIMVLMERARG